MLLSWLGCGLVAFLLTLVTPNGSFSSDSVPAHFGVLILALVCGPISLFVALTELSEEFF